MIRLAAAGWAAVLLPEQGGGFASLSLDGVDVLQPLPEGASPNSGRAGAFVMLPWCNRLEDGRLPWPGGEARFPINDLPGNNAIHGLSREHPWEVAQQDEASTQLVQRIDVAPFRYDAVLDASLDAAGLHLALRVSNRAEGPLPFGLGWHPWFRRPPGTTLQLRATHRTETDARGLPTAVVPASGVTPADTGWVGRDGQFLGWDGEAALQLEETRLLLRARGAWAARAQLFAPADRAVVCVEPVSHVTDVANRPALAPWGAMALLAPGEALEGSLSLLRAD
ncbi:aldose epimerase [Roseomonas sp. BN140053]|uniref:aldose epimerase family protein n=1 Tax=Roseomonas sp. BN140053 TaxID=3391898 RepID=UPI0039EAE9E2